MNTKPPVLTKSNTKMLAVEAATHKQARELAAQMGLPLYRTVAVALNALEIDLAIARRTPTQRPTGDDHANT